MIWKKLSFDLETASAGLHRQINLRSGGPFFLFGVSIC